MKCTWRSPIYLFFKKTVKIENHNGRRSHFFVCDARQCKFSAGGVRRFLDKGDKSSTANLKSHAIKCWGEEAVRNACEGAKPRENVSGSICAAFARQEQQPVRVSHRTHTTSQARAHIVKWVTESTRPADIISDRELRELLTAGRPKLELPSPNTVRRDIQASFERAQGIIRKLLQEYPGLLHFAIDTWTAPNHLAICACMVHLQHDGHMISSLLDLIELPKSHTGNTLAWEFHNMLLRYGLEEKVIGFVC